MSERIRSKSANEKTRYTRKTEPIPITRSHTSLGLVNHTIQDVIPLETPKPTKDDRFSISPKYTPINLLLPEFNDKLESDTIPPRCNKKSFPKFLERSKSSLSGFTLQQNDQIQRIWRTIREDTDEIKEHRKTNENDHKISDKQFFESVAHVENLLSIYYVCALSHIIENIFLVKK